MSTERLARHRHNIVNMRLAGGCIICRVPQPTTTTSSRYPTGYFSSQVNHANHLLSPSQEPDSNQIPTLGPGRGWGRAMRRQVRGVGHFFFPAAASAALFSSAIQPRKIRTSLTQSQESRNAPFFCFSRMIAAASSLCFWNSDPDMPFFPFCLGGCQP